MDLFQRSVNAVPNSPPSLTGVQGAVSRRDDLIYSAILLQHGGAGPQYCFTQPSGAAIPALKGSAATASTNAWQLTYSDATTCIAQAGQLGTIIGDVAVYSIGIHLEQAKMNPATLALSTWGATQYEAVDCASKLSFKLKVGSSKELTKGPIRAFPSLGGIVGSVGVTTTANATTASGGLATNGIPGTGRMIREPLGIAKTDTLIGEIDVAPSSSLEFRTTSGESTPTLLFVDMRAAVQNTPN